MKSFKAICAAMVLALSLSIPALADTNPTDVHEPGKSTTSTGSMTTSTETDSGDPVTTLYSDDSLSAFADALWTLASML